MAPQKKENPDLDECRIVGCMERTTNPSGYCDKHESAIGVRTEARISTCKDCAVRTICPMIDNERSYCYYEMQIQAKDFNERDSIEIVYTEMIDYHRRALLKLQRLADAPDEIIELMPHPPRLGDLLAEIRKETETLAGLMDRLATLKGWKDVKSDRAEKMARVKLAMELFNPASMEEADPKLSKKPKANIVKVAQSYDKESTTITTDPEDKEMLILPPDNRYTKLDSVPQVAEDIELPVPLSDDARVDGTSEADLLELEKLRDDAEKNKDPESFKNENVEKPRKTHTITAHKRRSR